MSRAPSDSAESLLRLVEIARLLALSLDYGNIAIEIVFDVLKNAPPRAGVGPQPTPMTEFRTTSLSKSRRAAERDGGLAVRPLRS
jgi:hypothetical protein